uniref:Uncharacterized protein n=1 Tax=Rhizophora mucronata TaxID=61149 RepID=A0A2P2K747_RHIMU
MDLRNFFVSKFARNGSSLPQTTIYGLTSSRTDGE